MNFFEPMKQLYREENKFWEPRKEVEKTNFHTLIFILWTDPKTNKLNLLYSFYGPSQTTLTVLPSNAAVCQ